MDVFIFLLGGIDFFLSFSLSSGEVRVDVEVIVVVKILEGSDMRALADKSALGCFEVKEHVLEGVVLGGVDSADASVKLVNKHLHL